VRFEGARRRLRTLVLGSCAPDERSAMRQAVLLREFDASG
jgi:hypothetical protein